MCFMGGDGGSDSFSILFYRIPQVFTLRKLS